MPQVSYASSSSKLNNHNTCRYFFRTYPPSNNLVKAMVDIVLQYSWGHVSVIFSFNPFGESLVAYFRHLAKENRICLDLVEPIYNDFSPREYHKLARELMTSNAKVVLLFTATDHTNPFMREMQNIYNSSNETERTLLWITPDVQTASKFKEIVAGMWGVVPFSKEDKSFNSYYSQHFAESNVRNLWFRHYYQERFDCFIGRNCSNVSITAHPDYQQYVLVPLVIDAVYSVAHAIHNSIMDNCPKPVVWYPNKRSCQGHTNTISGEMLANYLYKVNFTSPTGNAIHFDDSGSVEGKFNILNYQVVQACSDCNKT